MNWWFEASQTQLHCYLFFSVLLGRLKVNMKLCSCILVGQVFSCFRMTSTHHLIFSSDVSYFRKSLCRTKLISEWNAERQQLNSSLCTHGVRNGLRQCQSNSSTRSTIDHLNADEIKLNSNALRSHRLSGGLGEIVINDRCKYDYASIGWQFAY